MELIRGHQTLRFVQSLPKRERVPFSEKLHSNDPVGEYLVDAGRPYRNDAA